MITQIHKCKQIPSHFKDIPLKYSWKYKGQDGCVIGIVGRYQNDNASKQIVPFFKKIDKGWSSGISLNPRPLYGLHKLTNILKKEPVFIVEGEKCAAALHQLGYVALTCIGGSQSAKKADWEPLSGFDNVYLLPDNDKAGKQYANTVAYELKQLTNPPAILLLELPDLPSKGDIIDWIQKDLTGWDGYRPVPQKYRKNIKKNLTELIKSSQPMTEEFITVGGLNQWPQPISFDDYTIPEWPKDMFPKSIQAFVNNLSVSTETPIELASLMTLAVIATVSQGKYIVKMKPGYIEPVNIWTMCALPPASRKSSIIKSVIKPLVDWELGQQKLIATDIKIAESKLKTSQAMIEKLRKKSTSLKGIEFENAMEEISLLESDLPEIPEIPQLWADDVTPENLGTIMANNSERMAILSSEGGIIDIIAGRYSGGIPNMDIYLQGHAGDAVKVNRGSRASVMMNNPALTLGLCPQPDVLKALSDKPGFRGRGLIGRFLYAIPNHNLGVRTIDTPVPSEKVAVCYANILESILEREINKDNDGNIKPDTLNLSLEAYELWKDFWYKNEKEMKEGGRFEFVRDWAGKFPGAIGRIAALLHIADNAISKPENFTIQKHTMLKALSLVEPLQAHALLAFDMMGTDPEIEGARIVLEWMKNNKLEQFTLRECHYKFKYRFRQKKQLTPCINLLVENYYLRQVETKKKSGRPSEIYDVNPFINK